MPARNQDFEERNPVYVNCINTFIAQLERDENIPAEALYQFTEPTRTVGPGVINRRLAVQFNSAYILQTLRRFPIPGLPGQLRAPSKTPPPVPHHDSRPAGPPPGTPLRADPKAKDSGAPYTPNLQTPSQVVAQPRDPNRRYNVQW